MSNQPPQSSQMTTIAVDFQYLLSPIAFTIDVTQDGPCIAMCSGMIGVLVARRNPVDRCQLSGLDVCQDPRLRCDDIGVPILAVANVGYRFKRRPDSGIEMLRYVIFPRYFSAVEHLRHRVELRETRERPVSATHLPV